jgi:hypothetical protein
MVDMEVNLVKIKKLQLDIAFIKEHNKNKLI